MFVRGVIFRQKKRKKKQIDRDAIGKRQLSYKLRTGISEKKKSSRNRNLYAQPSCAAEALYHIGQKPISLSRIGEFLY